MFAWDLVNCKGFLFVVHWSGKRFLSAYEIAAEDKFDKEAFVITLEGENLWNNCGAAGVYNFQVFYDEVSLERATVQILLPIIFR